jgi:hypothetical protein
MPWPLHRQYPMVRRLGGPQSWYERHEEEKILDQKDEGQLLSENYIRKKNIFWTKNWSL